MPRKKTPSYRFHKARNCAVVTINGRDHYLGAYDSTESWETYHRLIAEHLAARREPPPPVPADTPLTIVELIARYWRFVKGYYVKEGRPTSEVASIKLALRFVRRLYGRRPARSLRPKHLKTIREAMIIHEIARNVKVVNNDTGVVSYERKVVRKGMARKCINKMIGRVRRMFAWAVEEDLVPVAVHARLLRVRGLRRGKSLARETRRVRPVSPEDIAAVLPLVPPFIRAMIEVLYLCGGRPQDVVQLRAVEIDMTRPVWEYRPRRFKTEHHNEDGDPDLDRVVYLGPRCQEILRPLLPTDPNEYVFVPGRSEAARNADRREKRKSPMTPTQAARKSKGRGKAPFHQHYPVASFRQAVRRACIKAVIPTWCPNQLRHSRLTEIRKKYGLEASRVCGGHREVGVTQMYAEQDSDLARQVMAEVG